MSSKQIHISSIREAAYNGNLVLVEKKLQERKVAATWAKSMREIAREPPSPLTRTAHRYEPLLSLIEAYHPGLNRVASFALSPVSGEALRIQMFERELTKLRENLNPSISFAPSSWEEWKNWQAHYRTQPLDFSLVMGPLLSVADQQRLPLIFQSLAHCNIAKDSLFPLTLWALDHDREDLVQELTQHPLFLKLPVDDFGTILSEVLEKKHTLLFRSLQTDSRYFDIDGTTFRGLFEQATRQNLIDVVLAMQSHPEFKRETPIAHFSAFAQGVQNTLRNRSLILFHALKSDERFSDVFLFHIILADAIQMRLDDVVKELLSHATFPLLDERQFGEILQAAVTSKNVDLFKILQTDSRYSRIRSESFYYSIWQAVSQDLEEVFLKLFDHPHFEHLSPSSFGSLLKWALEKPNVPLFQRFMEDPRFSQVPPYELFMILDKAIQKDLGEVCLNLFDHPHFENLSLSHLGSLLVDTLEKPNIPLCQRFMADSRFSQVPLSDLFMILDKAIQKDLKEVIDAICSHPNFHDIPPDLLGALLTSALSRKNLPLFNSLKSTHAQSYSDIPPRRLGPMFREAVKQSLFEISRVLWTHPHFWQIPIEDFGWAAAYALQTGDKMLWQHISKTNRFRSIPKEPFAELMSSALKLNLPEISTLAQHAAFPGCSPEIFGWVIVDSLRTDLHPPFERFHEDPRFRLIPKEPLGKMLTWATRLDHISIVKSLLEHPKFGDISPQDIGTAIGNLIQDPKGIALFDLLKEDPRWNLIPPLQVGEMFFAALKVQRTDIQELLLRHPQFTSIPPEKVEGIASLASNSLIAASWKTQGLDLRELAQQSPVFASIPQSEIASMAATPPKRDLFRALKRNHHFADLSSSAFSTLFFETALLPDESLQEFLDHPHFSEFEPDFLAQTIIRTLTTQRVELFLKTQSDPRFAQVSQDKAKTMLLVATRYNLKPVIEELLLHPRFADISPDDIAIALSNSLHHRNRSVFDRLKEGSRFPLISNQRQLEILFEVAAQEEFSDILTEMQRHPHFSKISGDSLGRALTHSVKNKSYSLFLLLKNDPRYLRLSASSLGAIWQEAASHRMFGILLELLDHPRFPELSAHHFGQAFAPLLRAGIDDLYARLKTDPRFLQISPESLGQIFQSAHSRHLNEEIRALRLHPKFHTVPTSILHDIAKDMKRPKTSLPQASLDYLSAWSL